MSVTDEERARDQRRQWTIEVVAGGTDLGFTDWLRWKITGGSEPRPLQYPPYMADNNDGLFVFFDVYLGKDYTLDVAPQLSGNVEITVGNSLFTLSHLDRANLLRALLHDFHYSPERGGPHDQD